MPYLTAEDGVPIYYTDRGEGAPIFLVHGWTMNHKFFERNIPELSRAHRVVTMDIRGHGHSGKQELNMSLRQAAKDARPPRMSRSRADSRPSPATGSRPVPGSGAVLPRLRSRHFEPLLQGFGAWTYASTASGTPAPPFFSRRASTRRW